MPSYYTPFKHSPHPSQEIVEHDDFSWDHFEAWQEETKDGFNHALHLSKPRVERIMARIVELERQVDKAFWDGYTAALGDAEKGIERRNPYHTYTWGNGNG